MGYLYLLTPWASTIIAPWSMRRQKRWSNCCFKPARVTKLRSIPILMLHFGGIQAFGGRLLDEEGRVVLNQGGFANWLGWLKSAQTEPNIILDNNEETLYTLFTSGEAAYYIGRSDVLTDLTAALGEDEIGVVPLPAGPNGLSGPLLRTEALMLNRWSSTTQTELALSLAKFLTNVEQQTRLAREINRTPSNDQVRIDTRLNPSVAGFLAQAKTAIPVPNLAQIETLQQEGDETYIQALSGVVNLQAAASELTHLINDARGLEAVDVSQQAGQCPTQLGGLIEVWHAWEEAEAMALTSITDNFMTLCPNITILLSRFETDQILENYQTIAIQGRGPTLLIGPNHWLVALANKGLISNIDGLLEPELLQRYLPTAKGTMQYQGQNYGLPLSISLMALYYKTDLVSDPARVVDDFLTQAAPDQQIALPVDAEQSTWGSDCLWQPNV